MRRLGVHTSIAGGLPMGARRARRLGCTTVQVFSHNPRSWLTGDLAGGEGELFSDLARGYGLRPVYVHASYLINISSPAAELRSKSIALLREEMLRADAMGADYLVLHLRGWNKRGGTQRARPPPTSPGFVR